MKKHRLTFDPRISILDTDIEVRKRDCNNDLNSYIEDYRMSVDELKKLLNSDDMLMIEQYEDTVTIEGVI